MSDHCTYYNRDWELFPNTMAGLKDELTSTRADLASVERVIREYRDLWVRVHEGTESTVEERVELGYRRGRLFALVADPPEGATR